MSEAAVFQSQPVRVSASVAGEWRAALQTCAWRRVDQHVVELQGPQSTLLVAMGCRSLGSLNKRITQLERAGVVISRVPLRLDTNALEQLGRPLRLVRQPASSTENTIAQQEVLSSTKPDVQALAAKAAATCLRALASCTDPDSEDQLRAAVAVALSIIDGETFATPRDTARTEQRDQSRTGRETSRDFKVFEPEFENESFNSTHQHRDRSMARTTATERVRGSTTIRCLPASLRNAKSSLDHNEWPGVVQRLSDAWQRRHHEKPSLGAHLERLYSDYPAHARSSCIDRIVDDIGTRTISNLGAVLHEILKHGDIDYLPIEPPQPDRQKFLDDFVHRLNSATSHADIEALVVPDQNIEPWQQQLIDLAQTHYLDARQRLTSDLSFTVAPSLMLSSYAIVHTSPTNLVALTELVLRAPEDEQAGLAKIAANHAGLAVGDLVNQHGVSLEHLTNLSCDDLELHEQQVVADSIRAEPNLGEACSSLMATVTDPTLFRSTVVELARLHDTSCDEVLNRCRPRYLAMKRFGSDIESALTD
jgi:hypothetical protein